jgi:hypothetical protein
MQRRVFAEVLIGCGDAHLLGHMHAFFFQCSKLGLQLRVVIGGQGDLLLRLA